MFHGVFFFFNFFIAPLKYEFMIFMSNGSDFEPTREEMEAFPPI